MASLLVSCGAYGLAAFGFFTGYFWGRFGPVGALILMLVASVVGSLAWRGLDRYLGRLAKERIKYLRGGQAEALVAWLLESLEDDWHVFNGVKLEADSDIDHVVVGPGGLFCVSTKSQRGLFTGTPDGLLHNGQPSPFARQALRQAMEVSRRLGVAMGRDVPWVQSVLAVPFGYVEGDACGGTVWLVHQDSLTERIAPENGPKRLDKQQVARTVKVLEMIRDTAADVYKRPAPTA
jgi:hypothetical protein